MERTQTTKKIFFNPLIIFSLIIFFVSLTDGLMSYVSPVILNIHLGDPFLVGLILSISSVFGIFLDFYVAENLGYKNFTFYIKWMVIFAFIFPLMLLFLPKQIIFFAAAMITWSIYYDFRNFSKFGMINKFFSKEKHTYAWAITNSYQSVAYVIGPALAVYLLEKEVKYVLFAAAISAVFGFFSYKKMRGNVSKRKQFDNKEVITKTVGKEIKILEILSRKMWPLILFYFSIIILDTCFWSTGVLFAERLRRLHPAGGLLLVIYSVPPIFMGLLAPKIILPAGKKKTSFITGMISAVFLGLIGFSNNIYLILTYAFFASSFGSITLILLSAVFEDYVARSKKASADIVTLSRVTNNLAYIIGPIFFGFIAKEANFSSTFIISATLILLTSLLALLLVPRKIKIPQKEIASELES